MCQAVPVASNVGADARTVNTFEAATSLADFPSATAMHLSTVPDVVTTTGSVYKIEVGTGMDPSVV